MGINPRCLANRSLRLLRLVGSVSLLQTPLDCYTDYVLSLAKRQARLFYHSEQVICSPCPRRRELTFCQGEAPIIHLYVHEYSKALGQIGWKCWVEKGAQVDWEGEHTTRCSKGCSNLLPRILLAQNDPNSWHLAMACDLQLSIHITS